MNKAQLRAHARRQPVSAKKADAVQRRLLSEDWWPAAFRVGLYCATATEPATDLLMRDLLSRRAQVAVPKARRTGYGWCEVDDETQWQNGPHDILEPVQSRWVSADALRVIVVPGVAFDLQGGRLGHGGGHYDRLLQHTGALLVGMTFENRLVAAVPQASHDVRMDVIVTEKRIRHAAGAEQKMARLLAGWNATDGEEWRGT